jgi:hypothetical protein
LWLTFSLIAVIFYFVARDTEVVAKVNAGMS